MSRPDMAAVIATAREAGLTIATAESLTGGALCRALVAPPGASDVVHGGVVVYTAAMKESVLGVDPRVIATHGVVSDQVALAMAERVCVLMDTTVGVATTGVAGPASHDGKPPGRVHVAVVVRGAATVRRFDFDGERADVVRQATAAAADMIVTAISKAHDS